MLQMDSPFWFIIGVVGREYRGAATASITLMQSLGQTISVAVFGSILNAYTLGSDSANIVQMADGIRAIFAVGLGIAITLLIIVTLMPTHRTIMEMQVK